MPTKHVYKNKVVDWFVAESETQATELWRDYLLNVIGEDPDEYIGDKISNVFKQVPDDEPLTIMDDTFVPPSPITKTATQWAEETPIGFLASTEW